MLKQEMRLYVSPMDAVLVDVDDEGRVKFEGEDWSRPTLQERRAIIYAAREEVARLQEVLDLLEK